MNVRLGRKGLPWTNTSLVGIFIGDEDKKKIALTPGVNVTKLFPLSLMTRPNKLECRKLAIIFQSSLTFAGNARSFPKKEASEMCSNWIGSGLALKI
jgi:hypothetical protein